MRAERTFPVAERRGWKRDRLRGGMNGIVAEDVLFLKMFFIVKYNIQ